MFKSDSVDHTVYPNKHKIVASFLCPRFSALSVTFNVRLYASALQPNLLVVEGQRREGCPVTFHPAWTRIVGQARLAGLVHSLYEARAGMDEEEDADSRVDFCQLATGLVGPSSPALNPKPEASLPSFAVDTSAFSILSNLVDHGDISQQRDALRLLSLSLMSSAPPCDFLPYLSLISRWSHSHTEDDERVTQLARLMLILTQKSSGHLASSSSLAQFITACAADLFSLLEGSVRKEDEELSMGRTRGVRYLLATLSLLSVKGGGMFAEVVQQDERRLLERCAEMKDATIQQDSRAVLQRLSLVC
jgi:hypothetical protein